MKNWLEDMADNVLFLAVLFSLLLLFLMYWKGAFQLRYAEVIIQDFLAEARVEGRFTSEQLEKLIKDVEKINPEYQVEISCMENVERPVYASVPATTLDQYYLERNIRKENSMVAYEVQIKEEKAEQLKFQLESNETILAEESGYLPLPQEGIVESVEAVRSRQEIYEGEDLITLCRVFVDGKTYYTEAAPMQPDSSGVVLLNVTVEEVSYSVPVEVICHPRYMVCDEGHRFVNSKKRVLLMEETGLLCCPYCEVMPETIKCSSNFLERKTGKTLTGEDIWITAIFPDGSERIVTPEDEGWQDNYDENYCGIQHVKISYCGVDTSVQILSRNETCKQCFESCEGRYYTDYVSFPYCTECMSKVPLFTGDVYEEKKEITFGEIVSLLDEAGEILFEKDEYICIRLRQGKRIVSLLQKRFLTDGRKKYLK